MSFTTLALFYLIASSSTQSCLTSSEDFAVEVVIPEYNINTLINYDKRVGNQYLSRSEYNPGVIAIVGETELPSGLSVRLQLPTITRDIKKPHLSLVSYSSTGVPRKSVQPIFNEWQIQCSSSQCIYDKDLITISAPFDKRTGVTLEINQALANCSSSCTGTCFTATTESKCIDAYTKRDLEELLRYTNVTNALTDLFINYRMQGSEEISVPDITTSTNLVPDWQEALRQELVTLEKEKTINLAQKDIEDISSLAKQGQAGRNYRIVYDATIKSWTYYNEVESADLTPERDCTPYSVPESTNVSTPLPVYYLIPLLLVGICAIALVMLIIIARIINKPHVKKYPKKKHLNISHR